MKAGMMRMLLTIGALTLQDRSNLFSGLESISALI